MHSNYVIQTVNQFNNYDDNADEQNQQRLIHELMQYNATHVTHFAKVGTKIIKGIM